MKNKAEQTQKQSREVIENRFLWKKQSQNKPKNKPGHLVENIRRQKSAEILVLERRASARQHRRRAMVCGTAVPAVFVGESPMPRLLPGSFNTEGAEAAGNLVIGQFPRTENTEKIRHCVSVPSVAQQVQRGSFSEPPCPLC